MSAVPRSLPDESLDALIARREAVAIHQVLPDRLALRPRESPSSISSRYGSQALAAGLPPGRGSRLVIAANSTPKSVITSWPVLPVPAGPTRRVAAPGFRRREDSRRCFPPNVYGGFDAPQRPSQPPQRDDLLFLFLAQDIAHVDGG